VKRLSFGFYLSLAALASATSLSAQTNEFMFLGNSVSYGTDATSAQSGAVVAYDATTGTGNTNAEGVALADLGPNWLGLDEAVPGSTTTQMIASFDNNDEQALFAPGVTNKVVVPWEASNQLDGWVDGGNANATSVQISAEALSVYNQTVAFGLQLQGLGDKVLAMTFMPRDEPGLANPAEMETLRLDYNTLVRNGWQSWANGFADVGGPNSPVGVYGNWTDFYPGTGSDVDLHLNNAGYAVVGNDVAAGIESMEVPEPSSLGLILLGLVALFGLRRLTAPRVTNDAGAK
jgi:hypothetical protein